MLCSWSELLQHITKNFIHAPISELSELNNLFIELSYKACNLRCKHCYIEKSPYKQEKDFIELEKVKKALADIEGQNIKSIYLTGGEPLMHNDFNQILRMCLNLTNVTILTNGTLINEKKARFLKKIDDESDFETIYRISFEHYEELKNDDIRGRGSFRKAFCATSGLIKYGFNPIISTVNYYDEPEEQLYGGFLKLFEKAGLDFEPINLKIIPHFKRNTNVKENLVVSKNLDVSKIDCINSRVLTKKGVFCCPILSGDFRARTGNDLTNYSKKIVLDTEVCRICLAHGNKAFVNDWM